MRETYIWGYFGTKKKLFVIGYHEKCAWASISWYEKETLCVGYHEESVLTRISWHENEACLQYYHEKRL